MDGAYSTQDNGEKCMSNVKQKVNRKRPLGRPTEDTIKIYIEWSVMVCAGIIWPRTETSAAYVNIL